MRISAISRVLSSTSAPVDRVSWHESNRVKAVRPEETMRQSTFRDVMDNLTQELHRRRTRVIEVVSAPGISSPRHYRLR